MGNHENFNLHSVGNLLFCIWTEKVTSYQPGNIVAKDRRGRSAVRFPGRSNRNQCRQELSTAATFFVVALRRREIAEMDPPLPVVLNLFTLRIGKFRNKFCGPVDLRNQQKTSP